MMKTFLWTVNLLVLFSLLVFAVASFPLTSFAGQGFEDLYGSELKSAPYSVRVRYANENGSPWAEATYDERFNYLLALQHEAEAELIAQQTEESAKIQAEALKEQNRLLEDAAQQNKQFARDKIKMDKRILEEKKKQDFQQKLDRQKQRIDFLRAQSINRR